MGGWRMERKGGEVLGWRKRVSSTGLAPEGPLSEPSPAQVSWPAQI